MNAPDESGPLLPMLMEVRATLARLEQMTRELVSQKTERPRLYEFRAAALLLSIHPKTVSKMVACGELMTVKIRGKRLIPLEEIDRACAPPRMKSSGASEERVRFDGAAALRRLDELTGKAARARLMEPRKGRDP